MRPLEIPSSVVVSATDALANKRQQKHITYTATQCISYNMQYIQYALMSMYKQIIQCQEVSITWSRSQLKLFFTSTSLNTYAYKKIKKNSLDKSPMCSGERYKFGTLPLLLYYVFKKKICRQNEIQIAYGLVNCHPA